MECASGFLGQVNWYFSWMGCLSITVLFFKLRMKGDYYKLLYVVILQECDSVISDVLAEAEAQDYASHFARHRITWEMLKTMTDKELKEVRGTKCNLVSSQPRFQGLSSSQSGKKRNPWNEASSLLCWRKATWSHSFNMWIAICWVFAPKEITANTG